MLSEVKSAEFAGATEPNGIIVGVRGGRSLTSVFILLACNGASPSALDQSESEAEAETESESEQGTEVVLADSVRVISDEQASTVEMGGDFLTFPFAGNEDLLTLEQGDVVVAGPAGPDTGNVSGFLREVLAVDQDGERIIIQAKQASLTDAIVSGEFHDTVDLHDDSRRYGPGGIGDITVGVNLDGFAFSSDPDLTISITRGRILFDPSFDRGMRIRRARLQHLTAVARGRFEIELALQVSAGGTTTTSREMEVWRSRPYVFTQLIGGIFPVVEVVTISLYAGVSASFSASTRLEAGLRAQGDIAAGVRYENQDWEIVAEQGLGFEATDRSFERRAIAGSVRGYIEPRVDIRFYGVGGPQIALQPYADATIREIPLPASWEISGGLRGRVGVRMSILDGSSLSFSRQLFDFDATLAQGTFEDEGEAEAEAEGEPVPDAGVHRRDGGWVHGVDVDASTCNDGECSCQNGERPCCESCNEVLCSDGLDTDGDGLFDCRDPDCAPALVCGGSGF